MTAGSMTAALHLVLDNQISSGLKLMTKQLDGLRNAGKQIGLGKLTSGLEELRRGIGSAKSMREVITAIGGAAERSGQQIKRMAQDLAFAAKYHATLGMQAVGRSLNGASRPNMAQAREQIGAIGGVAAGYSVVEPVREYAGYENTLRHIAITEKKSGPGIELEVARLTKLFGEDALSSGQSSESIAKAYSDLVQRGIPTSVLDTAIKAHSRAATAYNIPAEDMGPAVAALLQNMKVPEADLGLVLARMAYASKEGAFKVENFSQQLPGVTGRMAALGMTGETNANTSFAALETVMKNSSQPNQAAADFTDALTYLTSPHANKSFAKQGIDLPKMLQNAEKAGINPLDAVLGKVAQLTKGMSPVQAAEKVGALFGNQQAAMAILSLLQHKDDFQKLRKDLAAVGAETANIDFDSAFRAPAVSLRIFHEQLEQLERSLGKGFLPLLIGANWALDKLREGIASLNETMPGLGDKTALAGGAVVLLGGALGIIATVWPAVTAGFSLLLAGLRFMLMPLRMMWNGLVAIGEVLAAIAGVSLGTVAAIAALAGVLVAAAVDIYDHWWRFERFFRGMWDGLVDIATGAWDIIAGSFTLDGDRVMKGVGEIGGGLAHVWSDTWGIIEQLFVDFGSWVDGWTSGAMTASVDKIKDVWTGLKAWFSDLWKDIAAPFDTWLDSINKALDHIRLPRFGGGSPADDTGLPGVDGAPGISPVMPASHQLHVTVGAEPGTHATVDSPDKSVSVTNTAPLPPGRVLGRD